MSIGMEHGCFVTYQGQLYCVGARQAQRRGLQVGGNQYGQCGVAPPKLGPEASCHAWAGSVAPWAPWKSGSEWRWTSPWP